MGLSGSSITIVILFAVLLFSITICEDHRHKSSNDEGLGKFLIFSGAYMLGIFSYIVIYLTGSRFVNLKYVFILIIWFSYCAVLASMIIQSVYIFGIDRLWIRNCTASICYYSLFSVFIELFFNRFRFISNDSGMDFMPGVIPRGLYFGIPIITYYICMCYMLFSYHSTHVKAREKHLLKLATYAIIPSLAGLLIETACHVFFNLNYPVFFVLMVISYRLMSEIHLKYRSFVMKKEDFDYILAADKTDVIFICDDEQKVIYQNKAAGINSKMFKDEYIGRTLKDIFIIDRDVQRAMRSKEARNGLMVPAIYPLTNRNIVMSVEYIYDCVDEILCSIITIPNYEVALDKNTFVDSLSSSKPIPKVSDEQQLKPVHKDDIPLTDKDKMPVDVNSNILLVDDDLNNLSLYEKYFKTYNIKINRAASGRAALSKMLEPCYDAVFIAYDMERLNGVETAKRIRGMGGEYYNDVPIIFILNCPVANVYKDLLEVSFNDFIEMPINARKLNTIMTRWLWRRYAITDREDYDSVGLRIARFMDNLEQLCSDCQKACADQKWDYIGFMLKGMKRLCGKLEVKSLTSACDSLLDLYLNERYDELPFMLTSFCDELESIRDSGNISIKY